MSMSLSLVTTAATEPKQQQQQMSSCESKHQRLWDSHRGSFVYGVPTQGLPPPKKEKEKPLARKKNQSYRGVTWDKVKQVSIRHFRPLCFLACGVEALNLLGIN